MKSFSRYVGLALLGTGALAASGAHAQEEAAKLTGHVDVVSRYVLRGITTTYGNATPGLGNKGADAPESDRPALQWGADWVHPSGVYLGYWGSTINYSYKQLGRLYSNRSITDFQQDKSIENDLYGGYNGKLGDLGYTVGLIGYYYFNGKHANAVETKLGLSYGDFSVNAQTLLNDVVWGNKGDTYWTLNYVKGMPYDITMTASLGYYTYKKEGKFLGTRDTFLNVNCGAGQSFVVGGCVAGNAPSSGDFRHFILAVSQPIGNTGATWGVQGLLTGKNRFGIDQGNKITASLSYGF